MTSHEPITPSTPSAAASTGKLCYVTGATGFVGSHVAELLKARGNRVRLLVRSRSRLHKELQEGYEIAEGSLEDAPDKLAEGLKGVDYVYHVAGLIGATKQAEFDRVNVEGTSNIISAIDKSGTTPRRLLLVSSLASIGPAESPDKPVREDDKPQPRTMYGLSKLVGEQLAWQKCRGLNIPLTSVRPPAVYGPRDKGIFEFFKYMAKGMEVGIGSKKEPRWLDLIHGRDLARGIVMAAESERAEGEAYFITDEGKHDIRELMRILREAMQPAKQSSFYAPVWLVKVVAKFNDVLQGVTGKVRLPNSDKLGELLPNCWVCSGEKAREHFGFKAEISLSEGIADTARWYEEQGWVKVKRKPGQKPGWAQTE